MITVKQYADSIGKSHQAVYKQLRTKKNVQRLEGHVKKENGTTYLDDTAVEILNESRKNAVVIAERNQSEEIEKMRETINNLQIKLLQEQEKNNNLLEKFNTVQLENSDMKHLIETKDLEKARQQEKFEQEKNEKETWKAEAESFKPTFFGFYRKK